MPLQNKQSFNYEAISARDKTHPKFSLLAGLVFEEFGGAVLDEILSESTNATILACERYRKKRADKVAVLALGYFGPTSVFVPHIVDRSRRNTSHVAFFLDKLEDDAFKYGLVGAQVLTVSPGNLQRSQFSSRGYDENNDVPGRTAYQLSREGYFVELIGQEIQRVSYNITRHINESYGTALPLE